MTFTLIQAKEEQGKPNKLWRESDDITQGG